MTKLSPKDEQKLHDWITAGMHLNSEDEVKKPEMLHSEFESEYHKFQKIREALRSLHMLEPPRSFRLTTDMVGVKPPKPRFSLWMNTATAFFSLVFVFSLGLRINAMFFGPFANSEAVMITSAESPDSAEPVVAMAPARVAEPMDLTPLPDALSFDSVPIEEEAYSGIEPMEEPPVDLAMKAVPHEDTMPAELLSTTEPGNLDPGIQPLDWLVWISLLFVLLLLAFTGKMYEQYEEAWRVKWKNDHK